LSEVRPFFDRWGAAGVFLGHFLGPVRAIIPVIAGIYALPQWQFPACEHSVSIDLGRGRDRTHTLRTELPAWLTQKRRLLFCADYLSESEIDANRNIEPSLTCERQLTATCEIDKSVS
jgi:hypothetical protein